MDHVEGFPLDPGGEHAPLRLGHGENARVGLRSQHLAVGMIDDLSLLVHDEVILPGMTGIVE